MNRDQWHRKMRRDLEMFSYAGATNEDTVKLPVSPKHAGPDQERASDSPVPESDSPEFAMAQAEKYSACCEWDLSIKTKKR